MRRRWIATAALIAAACAGEPRGPCDPNPPIGELGSICGLRNPEDVEAIPSLGILVVSQMQPRDGPGGGSLALIDLGDANPTPRQLWPTKTIERSTGRPLTPPFDPDCANPPSAGFAPHGITAAVGRSGGVTLAVVAHGAREAIEFFELSGRGAGVAARWVGCIRLPPDSVGNDVVFGVGGAVLVSNFQPAWRGLAAAYYAVVAGLGGVTGDLIEKRPGEPWRRLAATGGPNPNGLLQSPGGGRVFFAQTGSGEISAVSTDSAASERRDITIGGHPDNLAWSARGTILAITHTDGLALLPCVFGRRPCRTGWSLFEIDPQSLQALELLHHDGGEIGAVASIAEIGGRYYFGAVYDDRIGVWTPP
jgi:hypothetical protein